MPTIFKPQISFLVNVLAASAALAASDGLKSPMIDGPLHDQVATDSKDVKRHAWRQNRNRMVAAQPGLQEDPTSIIIQFTEHDLPEWEETLRAMFDSVVIESWSNMPNLQHVTVSGDSRHAARVIEQIGQALGIVEFAEPDVFYQLGATPNDPYYSTLWALNNSGQTVNKDRGTNNADIDANLAWDVATGSTSMVVGMADSGIRKTHEDLAANIWTNPGEIAGNGIDDDGNGYKDDTWGWDFWNNDADPSDDNGHGSHTAGTVGAVGNNGKGITGVCWNVRLAALKIGSANGSVSVSAAISAINYCVGKGIKVSNHSWGGGTFSSAMDTAITNAKNAGHLMVCSAGNSGLSNETSPSYPASYSQDNILSVAATDNDDRLASFSNYGATRVDLGAPGVNIRSCYKTTNTTYSYLSGTSMAAPQVTGVAALVWSQNPSWSYTQVRSKILSSVKPLSTLSGKTVSGGLLNANNAVR